MITIQQSPGLYTPVYNPMRFVLSSTNTAQSNFKYVADLYVSGVSGRVFRGLYDADPTYGTAGVDISRILESYVNYRSDTTTDFDDSVFGFQRCTNSIKAYEVKFGEQYGPSSGVVTYPNLQFSGLKYAWNAAFSANAFRNLNYANYTPFSGGAILSNAPTTQYYYESTSHAFMYMLNDIAGAVYYAVVKTFDSSNSLIGIYFIENPYQASSSYLDKMIRVGVGYYDLNNTTLAAGAQPVITANVYKYTVTMTDFIGNPKTETYTYYTDCGWHQTSPVGLHFLNRLGGFDVFYFKYQRTQFSDIERDSMQKNLGNLTATTWGYNSYDRGKTIYNTDITDRWKLESDWINDSQSSWLQELVESPEVFYHDGTDMIPVTIVNKNYEVKTIKNMEKLFNLSLEIEFSNKRWTQRG